MSGPGGPLPRQLPARTRQHPPAPTAAPRAPPSRAASLPRGTAAAGCSLASPQTRTAVGASGAQRQHRASLVCPGSLRRAGLGGRCSEGAGGAGTRIARSEPGCRRPARAFGPAPQLGARPREGAPLDALKASLFLCFFLKARPRFSTTLNAHRCPAPGKLTAPPSPRLPSAGLSGKNGALRAGSGPLMQLGTMPRPHCTPASAAAAAPPSPDVLQ